MSAFLNWLTVSSLIWFCIFSNYSIPTPSNPGIWSWIILKNSGSSLMLPYTVHRRFLLIFLVCLKYLHISISSLVKFGSLIVTQDLRVTTRFFKRLGLHSFALLYLFLDRGAGELCSSDVVTVDWRACWENIWSF